MYILGLTGRPNTFKAIEDSPIKFAKEHKDLAKASPATLIFSMFLPDLEKVFIVGIYGKLDTACFFTTPEEMNDQRNRYAKFYTAREIYTLELSVKRGPAVAEASHPGPAQGA